MAPTLYRKPAHVEASGTLDPRRVYHCGVTGTIDESTVRILAEAYLGPVISTPFGEMFRGEITCAQTHYAHWDVDIEYLRRPKDIGTYSIRINGMGVTEHVDHSLETIAAYPDGTVPGSVATSAPSFKTLIGVEVDGNIIGADTIKPFARLTVTFNHPAGFMNLAYCKYLIELDGYVNADKFFVWDPGEVRYMGTETDSERSDGTVGQVTAVYEFEIQRNKTGIGVGSITGVNKLGWHLLWIKKRPDTLVVGTTTYPVQVPDRVYIERMSPTIDFQTAFGFG